MLARHWNKELRMSRLFDRESGRTVMVALDHGQGGVQPGLANPDKLLQTIINAGPDAILLSAGMARTFNHLFAGKGAPALVISSDFVIASTIPKEDAGMEEQRQTLSVQEAVRLGADAIKALLVFGRNDVKLQAWNMAYIARLAEECDRWNMPLIVEPTVWGQRITPEKGRDIQLNADMCRIAAELGADMVKTQYVGTPESFRTVIAGCPVPIAILGGSKQPPAEVAAMVLDGIEAGACGVVFGRNVWQHQEPGRMIAALKHLTYRGDKEQFLTLAAN
ncbi:MAG: fructose-bisphosphate aldolase, class [Clostridia bacterium]|nr:fructose-bisphosphate aldolase, class [Clostridia bacterium]